jgi:2-amino-4-hydroxy-6-hydroxymethyldihydropteridine diphosphokinase
MGIDYPLRFMSICHIGLGSNMGNRRGNLVAALELVGRLPGTTVKQVSRFIETTPVGGPPGQEPFLNAAVEMETILRPHVLLDRLREIEAKLGRARGERWGPRPIDLDILLFGDQRIDEPELTIPHPRMHFRRFVLEPLAEIAPEARHPAGWTIGQRWKQLNQWPHYLAITGPMGVGKTTVARQLAERLNAELVEEQFDSARLGRIYHGDSSEAQAVQQFFLNSRCELLDVRRWQDTKPHWLISDFWFGQSLAYAGLLLGPGARDPHFLEVKAAASRVIEATLVVWLDAPTQELASRVRSRGRDFEAPISQDFLVGLRMAYARLFGSSLAPPGYRPQASTPQELTEELLVVAQAISG